MLFTFFFSQTPFLNGFINATHRLVLPELQRKEQAISPGNLGWRGTAAQLPVFGSSVRVSPSNRHVLQDHFIFFESGKYRLK